MNEASFLKLTGMRLVHVDEHGASVELTVTSDLLQSLGVLHGGVTGALIDTTIGAAIYGRLKGVGAAVTVEFKVNFIRPAKLGEVLTARSEVLHLGRATAVGDARVTNQDGQLIAHGTGTYMRVTEKIEPILADGNQP